MGLAAENCRTLAQSHSQLRASKQSLPRRPQPRSLPRLQPSVLPRLLAGLSPPTPQPTLPPTPPLRSPPSPVRPSRQPRHPPHRSPPNTLPPLIQYHQMKNPKAPRLLQIRTFRLGKKQMKQLVTRSKKIKREGHRARLRSVPALAVQSLSC